MKPKPNRVIVMALAFVAIVGLVVLSQRPARSRRLSDGSVLSLVAVELGATNSFQIGSSMERMLGRMIPSNGVSLARIKLQRPMKQDLAHRHGEALDFLFRLSGAKPGEGPLLGAGRPDPQLFVVIRARNGHEYEGHVPPFSYHLLTRGKNRFAIGSLTAFPRDERSMEVELVAQRESNREVIARFRIKNPATRTASEWRAEATPIVRRFDSLEPTIGQVTISPRVWRTPQDPSETGSIPLRVLENGSVTTNWALQDIKAHDALGNYWYHGSHASHRLTSNDWRYHMIWSGLDPGRVWRLEAQLARDSGFAPDELHTVRLTMPLRGTIQTNFQGVPVEIGFVNTDMLRVEILTNRPDLRLSFVRATDKSGKEIQEWSGSWGQWNFWRLVNRPPSGEWMDGTFAIHRNYPFECFVQAKPKAPSASSAIAQ